MVLAQLAEVAAHLARAAPRWAVGVAHWVEAVALPVEAAAHLAGEAAHPEEEVAPSAAAVPRLAAVVARRVAEELLLLLPSSLIPSVALLYVQVVLVGWSEGRKTSGNKFNFVHRVAGVFRSPHLRVWQPPPFHGQSEAISDAE